MTSYFQAHKESKQNITNLVILREFKNYLVAKGKSLNRLSYCYHDVIRLMERRKEFNLDEMIVLLSNEKVSNSNVRNRVLKGTKTDNVRFIPMDAYLYDLLQPICSGRNQNEFVFVNNNGNAIDDKMFLRRVFRPVLEHLRIDKRDLYACRHTFATRTVQNGMKPHEVAYIMGDSVEIVLNNYFHNNRRPDALPAPVQKPTKLKVA